MNFIDSVSFWIGIQAAILSSLTAQKRQTNCAIHVGVNNLESVERLGAIGILCNNKVGTLTTNIMTVQCYLSHHVCDYH